MILWWATARPQHSCIIIAHSYTLGGSTSSLVFFDVSFFPHSTPASMSGSRSPLRANSRRGYHCLRKNPSLRILMCKQPKLQRLCDRLHRRLETIRTSANTILVAFTKSSLTSDTLDGRTIDWPFSGELSSCLGKLKEMDNVFKPDGHVQVLTRPLTLSKDRLTAAMSFFDKYSSLFHFLLTRDVW